MGLMERLVHVWFGWKWVVQEEGFLGAMCGLNWIGFCDIEEEREKTNMAI